MPWGLLLKLGAPIALALVLFGWGYSVGGARVERKHEAALLKATTAAREREAQWESERTRINDDHRTQVAAVAAERDAAFASLRDRPIRRLPPAAACSGDGAATGAQLSKPDSEFLVGLAAEADRLLADLKACRAWAEAVSKR